MKSILILANKYPNPLEPNVCVFIQQLVWSFADMGYECSVVSPKPVNLNPDYRKLPDKYIEVNENGKNITVYQPKCLSAGQSGKFAQKLRVKFTTWQYIRTVEQVIKNTGAVPDVFYAHFLCPTGVAASYFGKKYKKPAFMAHGEATYAGNNTYGNQKLASLLSGLTGVVAVSSQNREFIVDAGIVSPDIVQVFPNGYREERFYPRDRKESRKRFGFPEDAYIVGMCGSFDERKGPLRIQAAVDQIPNVFFACAGKGTQVPTSERCLWAQPVNNEDLSWFYSALDIFVLPTQNEGCCNAIVEAIACGCPIISSDRSFNVDICDETNSILIDPDSVDEIRDAIISLKNDPQRRAQLAQGSLEKAKSLTLSQRAKNIASFMNL